MSGSDDLWLPPGADPRPQGARRVENVVRAVPGLAPRAVAELREREADLRRKAKKVRRAKNRAQRQARREARA